jgi:hypothetical protein
MTSSQTRQQWSNPSSIVYERKFDSPLRDSTCKVLLEKLVLDSTDDLDHMLMKRYMELERIEIDDIQINTPIYALMLNQWVFQSNKISQDRNKWLETAIKYSLSNYEIQKLNLCANLNLKEKKDLRNPRIIRNNLNSCKYLRKVSYLVMVFSKLVDILPQYDNIRRKDVEILCRTWIKNKFTDKNLDLRIRWTPKYALIRFQGQSYILPREYILLIYNKLSDLFSILLLSLAQKDIVFEGRCHSILLRMIKHLTDLAIKYKNKVFDILKSLEGIVAGEILIEVDGITNQELLRGIHNNLKSSAKYSYIGGTLQGIIQSCPCIFKSELACLSKIVGHPFVNMEEGSKSLYKKMNEIILINPDRVLECVRHCKRDFIKSYIIRHKKWPPCTFDVGCERRVLHAHMLGRDLDSGTIREKFGPPNLSDYDTVNLGKIFDFNYLENYIPYLKDKSVSLLRSDVISKYIDREVGLDIKWQDTRQLLVYLLNPESVTDHTSYIRKYMKSSTLDDLYNYLVIKLVPKEKELKIDFRGFGIRTYEDRARSLAQEKNVMHFLDMYSDEQAMTIGELEQIKKLYAFRVLGRAFPGYKPLYINLDASSWNNKFRHDVVSPVCSEVLDKVFGTNIFSKTQLAFEKGLTYIPDIEQCYYWDGQAGGVEGQNQDTWVVTYISQIKASMPELGLPCHIFCKGDDFRLIVLVPPNLLAVRDEIDIKNEIVEHITRCVKEVGHTIKIDESYGSAHYLVFSKNASVDEIELSSSYRKIQKCYGANNAFMNTLADYIGSTFSNAHSACKVTSISDPCYIVALVWSYFYLLKDDHYRKLSENELVSLLLVPSLLGGFPIIYLHNMYVRAESDLLSPFIELYLFTQTNFDQIFMSLTKWFYQIIESPRSMFRGLMSDPYCLPVRKPLSASSRLRSDLSDHLLKITKNESLKQLFGMAHSKEQTYLEDYLFAGTPWNIKAMCSIMSASPWGLMGSFLRKFESGRSVLDTLVLRRPKAIAIYLLQRAQRSEHSGHMHRIATIKKQLKKSIDIRPDNWENMCSTEIASTMRKKLWGRNLDSVTVPSQQHLLHIIDNSKVVLNEYNLTHYFKFITSTPDSPYGNVFFSTAHKTPFLGHRTSAGVLAPMVHFIEKDAVLSKVKELLNIFSWMNYSVVYGESLCISNVKELINSLLNMYTDETVTTLAPFSTIKHRGTIQHHFRCPQYKESIVPNNTSNIYLCFSGNARSHSTFSDLDIHYNINFLHSYCHTVSTIMNTYVHDDILEDNEIWAITTPCLYCNIGIFELPMVFDTDLRLPRFEKMKYARVSKPSMRVLKESLDLLDDMGYKADEYIQKLDDIRASYAVLHLLWDNTVGRVEAISDRFGGHAFSYQGTNLLSSIITNVLNKPDARSDILYIPLETVCKFLQMMIIYILSDHGQNLSRDNMVAWLNTTPLNALPWTNFLGMYQELGLLPDLVEAFVDYSRSHTHYPSSDLQQVSKVIGHLSINVFHDVDDLLPGIILSYQDQPSIMRSINPILKYYRYYRINSVLIPLLMNADEEESKTILAIIYMYRKMPDLTCQSVYDVALSQIRQGAVSLNVDYTAFIDEEQLEAISHDIELQDLQLNKMILDYTHLEPDSFYEDFSNYFGMYKGILDDQYGHPLIPLVYSNLQDCCRMLRAQPRIKLPRRIDQFNDFRSDIIVLRSPKIKEFRTRIQRTEMLIPFNINPCPEIYQLRMNPRKLYARYGLDTLNSVILDHLWGSFITDETTTCNSLCLADGHGGQSLFIAEHVTRSIITIVTLVTEEDYDFNPCATKNACERGGNQLDLNMMRTGVCNLLSDVTFNYLLTVNHKYSLIVLDIEMIPIRAYMSIAEKLIPIIPCITTDNHVSLFHIEKECFTILPNIVANLSKIYNHIGYIVNPAKSVLSGIYVVCWNPTKSSTKIIYQNTITLTARYMAELSGWINHIIQGEIDPVADLIVLNPIIQEIQALPNRQHLNCYWQNMSISRLGFAVGDEIWTDVILCLPTPSNLLILQLSNLAHALLHECSNEFTLSFTVRETTHSKAVGMASRFMSIQGFLYVCIKWDSEELSQAEIRQMFFMLYEGLPNRLLSHCIRENLYNNLSLYPGTLVFRPFYMFLRGIQLGLSYRGWSIGYVR